MICDAGGGTVVSLFLMTAPASTDVAGCYQLSGAEPESVKVGRMCGRTRYVDSDTGDNSKHPSLSPTR